MKNCILKGLCVIFILMTLMVMLIPVSFAEQYGHGGTTEVIAHVDPPAETQPQTESSTEPSDKPVTPADSSPVQTGEAVAWFVLLLLLLSAAVLLILRLNNGKQKE